MIKLDPMDYKKVFPLIQSDNDLTVFAALEGTINNEVLVDCAERPSCTLIKLPGKNLVAGSPGNDAFIDELSSALDFWDQLTPDDERWEPVISRCHPNKFIRQYKRRRYILAKEEWRNLDFPIAPGFVIEKVNLPELRIRKLQNDSVIYEWAGDYLDDGFAQHGLGYYARCGDVITNWSMSDGHYQGKIAIGIQSNEEYRRRGLGIATVTAMVNECFRAGFSLIEWQCVDFNKGSRAIAEKLGFRHVATYNCYTSYPPCENILDLSEREWNDWAEYYSSHSDAEPRLLGEQLSAYLKANDDAKAKETLTAICNHVKAGNRAEFQWIARIPNTIEYLHKNGMAHNLSSNEWSALLKGNGTIK